MTRMNYTQVMKEVGIADLKAHLSEHLRSVRRGQSLTVLDRETPIARIVPVDGDKTGPDLLVIRRLAGAPPTGRVPLPPPLGLKRDVMEFLGEERQSHR